jgi:hypothetical protein
MRRFTRSRCAALRRQRGQATTEFVVLALVLVPLFIAVPLVGKYLDLMNASETASRYVAFESVVRNSVNSWKSDASLSAEVRRRIFSNPDAPIKTGDTAGDFVAHRNPLWTDHTGQPFLETFEQGVQANGVLAEKNAIPAAFFKGALKLTEKNLQTGTVTVKLTNVPEFKPFDELNLQIVRKTVLLSDTWAARDLDDVKSRIEDSIEVYPIGAFKPIIDPLGNFPTEFNDPKFRVSDFDWDIVPCDRIVGGC